MTNAWKIVILCLLLSACTEGIQHGRNLSDRVVADTRQVLDTRHQMELEYLVLVVEWCEILRDVARDKRKSFFGQEGDTRAALELMLAGDPEGARAALAVPEMTLDQVDDAYKAAKECYDKEQPRPTRGIRAVGDVKKVIKELRDR